MKHEVIMMGQWVSHARWSLLSSHNITMCPMLKGGKTKINFEHIYEQFWFKYNTEVLCTPSSTWSRSKPMTSTSWRTLHVPEMPILTTWQSGASLLNTYMVEGSSSWEHSSSIISQRKFYLHLLTEVTELFHLDENNCNLFLLREEQCSSNSFRQKMHFNQ